VRIFASLVFLSVLIFSCAKKKLPENRSLLGLDYYPVNPGKFVVYDVDSMVYYDLAPTLHVKYRIKEKLANTFTDNEGKQAIRLERYIKFYNPNKSYDSIPWTMKEVWMVNADNKSIQVSESNVRFTKLIFPVQKGASWNGNARNTLGEQTYTYDYIDKSEIINGQNLANVLHVKQNEFRTAISFEKSSEKYAKDIGLVFREWIEVYSNTVIPGVPVEQRVEHGVIFKQTLVTYGYE
jgi:hypothetical protein